MTESKTRFSRKAFSAAAALGLAALALLSACRPQPGPALDFSSNSVQGVRFDPSYYYDLKQPLGAFVDSAVEAWRTHGINTVFFKAYDPEYGAVYRTSYPGNALTDYGKKDLLGLFLKACHARGLRVIAWVPAYEHKGAWLAHPEWRVKAADGSDADPVPGRHMLCVRQPGFLVWWRGFLQDMLDRHPDLDGVDLAEPASVWKGGAVCACPVCRKEFGEGKLAHSPAADSARARGLTEALLADSRIIAAAHRIPCVTWIATAAPSSDLLPFARQKQLSGLDVDALLDSPDRPQWLSIELLWQQWADTYDNPAAFRPDWTRKAVEQCVAGVRHRATLIAHVEITHLGPVEVSPDDLVESIAAARRGGAQGVEFYDTHLADSLGAWTALEKGWSARSDRRAIVLHDPKGEGAAKQVAALYGHFGIASVVAVVDSFSESMLAPNDLLTYVGNKENYPLPAKFLEYAARPTTKIFWCDFNLWQLDRPVINGRGDTNTFKDSLIAGKPAQTPPSNGVFAHLGLRFMYLHKSADYNTVLYKGQELFKTDSMLNRVQILDSTRTRVHAWVRARDGERSPYIVQSGNFWFVADCPTDYIVEGGRDLAFADILHDFIGDSHPEKRTALVRIEDVCPMTDPASIKAIADLLHREGVPFSIALVPFYVDPEDNIVMTMSERPQFVEALHYAVEHGATIVMHGSTHQYRGRSTFDYELWDKLRDGPIFEDSKEYVRARLQRGIDEMRKNGIYPIAFETPHYACSQLDYSVINQFFSAEYGRRQVIDKTGFDQLVPYFISRHPSGNAIIPENLGYVPNARQDATPLLRFAKNNLVVRDGFASFFFHPWIDRKVLQALVEGIRDLGYSFSDLRDIPLRMNATGITQVTGSQEAALKTDGKFLHTFFLDERGRMRKEWYSETPLTLPYAQEAHCPPGWSFVAETVEGKPKWYRRPAWIGFGSVGKSWEKLFTPPPLRLAAGNSMRPGLLWLNEGDTGVFSDTTGVNRARRPRAFPPSQEAWSRALQAIGLDFDTLRVERLLNVPEDLNMLVVPARAGARLSASQALILSRWGAQGHALVLEGPSPLSDLMGLHVVDSGKSVSTLKDDFLPQVGIRWPKPSPAYAFDADTDYVNQYSADDDAPLVAGGTHGSGKYLCFATPFAAPAGEVENGSAAPQRFPFLLDMLQRQFEMSPPIHSPSLEVYFDPGNREDVPIEQSVANWRKAGVRAVYLAAWHDYRKYTFEYGYMASLLHRAGIQAYAWFEVPSISDRFWQDHPAWREKTALGLDAEMESDIGWKQFMNLTNDTCRAGAYNSLKRMLLLAPWDGVILTGRMFAGDNPDSAQHITPFHPSFRAQYRRVKGYDPQEIFQTDSPRAYRKNRKSWNEFLAYRDSVEQWLTFDLIEFLEKQKPTQKAGSEIILTRPLLDVSAAADSLYARLLEKHPQVRLQMAGTRERISPATLAKDVQGGLGIFPKWRPMAEINFEYQKPASGITGQLCGMELMDLVASAAKSGVRLSLRTEDHIYDADFRNLAYAAAAPVHERQVGTGWEVRAPQPAEMDLEERSQNEVLVDGNVWPAYAKGRLLLPAGDHRIQGCPPLAAWKALLQAPVRIAGCNAGLVDVHNTLMGLTLTYTSTQSASLLLTQKPLRVLVDGLPQSPRPGVSAAPAAAPPADETLPAESIELPAGSHTVDIATRPLATSVMREASVGLSLIIILISSLTVAAFALLYAGGWLRRLYSGERN